MSCIGAAAASGALGQRRALLGRATVSVYASSTSGVLDSFWDSKGPVNLERQLNQLKLKVARFAGRAADAPIQSSTRTFIIPPVTGDSLYSDVEDTQLLRKFVQAGGLVVVHDSVRRPEATQDLVANILGYQGAWLHCEAVTDNSRRSFGGADVSSHAREFLNVAWPQRLEDARTVQIHSWCKHEDSAAVSYPLYTIGDDSMKAVAQAFTRVGTPGAVLWLGYSWQSGPQPGWGALLGQLIAAFDAGAFSAPSDASPMDAYPLQLDAVLAAADSLADDTADLVRRYLAAQATGGYGYYPPSYPVPVYPPSPLPPSTLPPKPTPPTPMPTPSPPANETAKRFLWYKYMPAQGVQGVNKPVVWFDDTDFDSQLNSHYNNSKLWLVDREKQMCDLEPPCRVCQQAWYPHNDSDVGGFPSHTVVLYFREPMLLKRVVMLELAAQGIEEVFLLSWPAVPIPELGINVTRTYDTVNMTTDVYKNLRRRPAAGCATRVDAYVKPPRSDDPQYVPPPSSGFNQTNLPAFFASRAVGGVGIRMRAPPSGKAHRVPQIAEVRFIGRVLYPQRPAEYAPYVRSKRVWEDEEGERR